MPSLVGSEMCIRDRGGIGPIAGQMVVIDHRHPLGIFAFRFYANPAFDRGKDLRLEEPGDGAGIVQRRAVEAPLFIFVVGHKEVEQFGDDGRHRVANLAESLDIGGQELRTRWDSQGRPCTTASTV